MIVVGFGETARGGCNIASSGIDVVVHFLVKALQIGGRERCINVLVMMKRAKLLRGTFVLRLLQMLLIQNFGNRILLIFSARTACAAARMCACAGAAKRATMLIAASG